MPRTIHFRVEGGTEKFLQEMKDLGLSERDVFAKALGLLNLVHKTGRVAFLNQNATSMQAAHAVVDFVFTLQDPAKIRESSTQNATVVETTTIEQQESNKGQTTGTP